MKHMYMLTALVAFMLGIMAMPATAQMKPYENPAYGADSASRIANAYDYNYLSDKYKARDYDGAVALLNDLLVNAPKISQNIYIYGANIYRTKIATAKSLAEKKSYVDSLMYVYDKRIEAFGDHATQGKVYIMNLKAGDYLNYNPADRDGIRDLYVAVIDEAGNNADQTTVLNYFNAMTTDYKNMGIETDLYLTEYDRLNSILESKEQTEETIKNKETFEGLFIGSGAADCDNLEKLFRPRFEANPNDTVLMAKTMRLLIRNKCQNDFILELGEAYYAVAPSSEIAMLLASSFEERKDYEKSRQYLTEAIAVEPNPTAKANLAVRIAGSEIGAGNLREAASFARQAIEINPENGFAYLLLAQSYGMASGSSCNGFESQAASWLVVDFLAKAKSLLSNDASQVETINGLISTYSAYFPSAEECFFRNLDTGASYSVNCGWITGRTTVRTNR